MLSEWVEEPHRSSGESFLPFSTDYNFFLGLLSYQQCKPSGTVLYLITSSLISVVRCCIPQHDVVVHGEGVGGERVSNKRRAENTFDFSVPMPPPLLLTCSRFVWWLHNIWILVLRWEEGSHPMREVKWVSVSASPQGPWCCLHFPQYQPLREIGFQWISMAALSLTLHLYLLGDLADEALEAMKACFAWQERRIN